MAFDQAGSAPGFGRGVLAALLCATLASCSSSSDPAVQLGFVDGADDPALLSAAGPDAGAETVPQPSGQDKSVKTAAIPIPTARPEAAGSRQQEPEETQPKAASQPAAEEPASKTVMAEAKEDGAAAKEEDDDGTGESGLSEKKRGFLSAFFSTGPKKPNPALHAIKAQPAAPAADSAPEKPTVTKVALTAEDAKPVHASLGGDDFLPGVRQGNALFEITSRSGSADESTVDVYEDVGLYQVASAGGMGRGMHGLIKQRADVQTGCFKPALVRMLKKIERRYGKPILVTSGYRSPKHNRRVHGAPKSMHMYCAAADIKVAGVSKWELARYARSLPGRGGVGTYCHTNAIHVDVGPERDWNWRCRRRD